MADIRINSLSTTASSTASDDFLAVDGTTNGTRKLNAYSPTFGGNLTVSGTGSINGGSGAAAFAIKETASAATALSLANRNSTQTWGIAVDAAVVDDKQLAFISGGSVALSLNATTLAATLAGNLTVSGTGVSQIFGTLLVGSQGAIGASLDVQTASGTASTLRLFQAGVSNWVWSVPASTDALVLSQYGTNEALRINSSRNLLVGTTTDGGQKLQVSGTASISGNATFGGDITISSSYPKIALTDTNNNSDFSLLNDNGRLAVYDETNAAYRITVGAGGGVKIGTTPEDVGANNLTVQGTVAVSGTLNVGTGASNSSYQNIYTNKSENTAGPVSITLPSDCTGTVRVSSYQSGVGRSFRTIPFLNFGGTVTLGTSDTTVVTADPVTSVAAGTGAVTLNLVAANTNVYWGIDVVKA